MTIADHRPAAAPPPSDAAQHPARRLRAVPKRAWATYIALLAALPASIGLVFTLWPGLKPDPGDRLAAQMEAVTVDPDVTYGNFVHYLGRMPPRDGAATARTTGAVVYVKINVHGRKHRHLDLYYSLYHARARTRYANPTVNRASYFSADTPDDQWVATVWVPDPPAFDRVFVRLELYDGDSMLAVADSPAFRFPLPSLPRP